MQALGASYPGSVVSLDTEAASEDAREFEQRLADCSNLAGLRRASHDQSEHPQLFLAPAQAARRSRAERAGSS